MARSGPRWRGIAEPSRTPRRIPGRSHDRGRSCEHPRDMARQRQRDLGDHGAGRLAGRAVAGCHAADLAVTCKPLPTTAALLDAFLHQFVIAEPGAAISCLAALLAGDLDAFRLEQSPEPSNRNPGTLLPLFLLSATANQIPCPWLVPSGLNFRAPNVIGISAGTSPHR